MAYDIFQRFRNFRPHPNHGTSSYKAKERRKLIWYTVYATGSPLIITGITAVLQFVNLGNIDHQGLKPDFGESTCFFNGQKKLSAFVLFYIPLLLLQVSLHQGQPTLFTSGQKCLITKKCVTRSLMDSCAPGLTNWNFVSSFCPLNKNFTLLLYIFFFLYMLSLRSLIF